MSTGGAQGTMARLFGLLSGHWLPGRTRDADPRLLPVVQFAGPMPWVIAIMIALTVVAAASALALRNAAQSARSELEGGVTVQIVFAEPETRNRQADAAMALLAHAEGVRSARRVAQDELNTLVEPWLGTRAGDDIDALPIPALIDVRVEDSASPARLDALRKLLHKVAPDARVDAQAAWLVPVFRAMAALQWLAAGLIALLASATVFAVLLASRNALGNHRDTIEIVHMLGGTDHQIARVFQRSMAIDAAAGGVLGLIAGVIATATLGHQFSALGSGMTAAAVLGWRDWLVIGGIPVLGVALSVLTARLSVLAALRRLL